MANTDKLRICGYFVVSDLHKITEADIRFCSEDLFDEIANHDEWILESIVWDANHKIDTNREGLNIILEKAKNDEFDILLLHHVTLISRSVTKTFDYALQLYKGKKSVYGIVDGIHSMDEFVNKIQLGAARKKQWENTKKALITKKVSHNGT